MGNSFAPQKAFRRKHDDPSAPAVVAKPKQHLYPTSVDELVNIVRAAELQNPTPEVRATGSHWALSDAALTTHFIVETRDPDGDPAQQSAILNKTLYNVIPGCLTQEAERFFLRQGVQAFDPARVLDQTQFYLYHVEAGTKIWELYSRLDKGDDEEKESLARKHGFDRYKGPWAMATLGGAGGQTIVGAFSTGTHGGDVHLPPIADAVQALHLVGPEGRQYWFERGLGTANLELVDESKLRRVYGDIEVIRDPEHLNAVIVAAGRMGIIYSVVLKVMRQYALNEVRTAETWSNVRTWINKPNNAHFNGPTRRFVQVVINPNPQVVFNPAAAVPAVGDFFEQKNEHSCFVSVRDLRPLDQAGTPPYGREERRLNGNAGNSAALGDSGGFFATICESDSPIRAACGEIIKDLEDARDTALITGLAIHLARLNPFTAWMPWLLEAEVAAFEVAAAAEALIGVVAYERDAIPVGPLGSALASFANWAAETDHWKLFRLIAEKAFAADQKPRAITAISYAAMDIHNYRDFGCTTWGDSLEVFFDGSTNSVPDYVDLLFRRVEELKDGSLRRADGEPIGKPMAFAGYIAVRFMAESAAFIGMQQWPFTCSLEIAGVGEVEGVKPFLDAVERDAIDAGATVHWGQRNNLNVEMVEKCFDSGNRLTRWREILATLSRNGRLPTFSTPFTRERGLEVVQPLVGDLAITPTHGCAGSPVSVRWHALDNPPGTTAHLHITSEALPPTNISLAGLEGVQDIPLPMGASSLELEVAYTYPPNGKTRRDRRAVSARGFVSGDVWTLERTAQCVVVDGLSRWSFELDLSPDEVSDKLAVTSLGISAIPFPILVGGDWYARRAGIADVQLPYAGVWVGQVVAVTAKLQGSWLFFSDDVGCTGPPPSVSIAFGLDCT